MQLKRAGAEEAESNRYQFTFIMNTSPEHSGLIYKKHPLWKENNFVKPDVYDWKTVGYTDPNGNFIKGRMLVIGSDSGDIVGTGRGRAAEQTRRAINYAREALRVPVICFGASTKTLAEHEDLPTDVIFSNGDTLTVAVALEELADAAAQCGIELNSPKTKVLIIGAYGIIGKAMAKNLSKLSCRLLLLGRNAAKLNALNQEIGNSARTFLSLSEVREKVDVVVTVTNHPSAILDDGNVERLGTNLLILDPSWPANVSKETCERFKGKLIRLDGCIMTHQTMFYESGESEIVGLGPKEFPACVGETMVIATALQYQDDRQKIEGVNFMKVSDKNIPMILSLAKKYRFARTHFACFKKPVTEQYFEIFKQNKKPN